MDLGLSGRGYLLTGASRGLGFATAQALVDDGARVLVSSRSADGVATAADRLGGAPGAFGTAADLADAGDSRPAGRGRAGAPRPHRRRAAVGRAARRPARRSTWPRTPGGPVSRASLLGPLRLVKALVPHLGEGAAIGFVLSTSVREPLGPLAISNGLRPGLAMTAKALADELGPRGIRVFGLMPGTIATDRIAEIEAASGDPAKRPGPHRGGHPAAPGRPARRSSAGSRRSPSPPPRPT